MAKLTETVLYYNPGRPETMKHVAMMKSVLVRMGIRIRNIGPEQVWRQWDIWPVWTDSRYWIRRLRARRLRGSL